MGEYLLTLLLAIRIGLQAMMFWFVLDSYRETAVKHSLYAVVAYGVVLLTWLFDAMIHFQVIPMSEATEILQQGVMPLFISLCFVVLAVSSKAKRGGETWTQPQ